MRKSIGRAAAMVLITLVTGCGGIAQQSAESRIRYSAGARVETLQTPVPVWLNRSASAK